MVSDTKLFSLSPKGKKNQGRRVILFDPNE
jgi:hypothetical protein